MTAHSQLAFSMDWADMDLFGHINNVALMKYAQSARVHFWETYGIPSLPGPQPGPVLASAEFRFLHSLVYPGKVRIETRLTGLGNTSFTLEHRIFDENGKLCVEARDVTVMLDYAVRKKSAISGEMRSRLSALLEA